MGISDNTQISENDVSDSEKNKLKLSDLLFEYLEIGKNFKNTEKDDSESEKPLVFIDPRKMHKKFYEKLFECFKQEEEMASKENKEKEEELTKENNENDDVEIKGFETSQDCKEIEAEAKEKVVEEKPLDEPLKNELIKDEPLVEEALKIDVELKNIDKEAI